MLTHPMLDQLGQLGLSGMARAFSELEASDETAALTHADWLGLLLDTHDNLILCGPTGVGKSWLACDPLAGGELLEQSAVEAAWGPVIDVLDAGRLAQSGVAQPGGKPLVAAGELAIQSRQHHSPN